MLHTTYNKILNNSSITFTEATEFVENTLKIFNPTADVSKVIDFMLKGWVEPIIQACVNIIKSNPDMFKIQTYVLVGSQRIIKQWSKKL